LLQGDWIKESADGEEVNNRTVSLCMYKVVCENIGFSKDTLLTETSDFALLFGRELDSEVSSV
jgi:endoribonuclease Dicer